MANNRMYILHPPSGLRQYLGKRMASGYYCPPEADTLQLFYDMVEQWVGANGTAWRMDDFVIDYEIEPNTI